MREILFRGKRVDNGEWVYGLICRVGDKYANIVEKSTEVMCTVLTNTIGQFTGLTDKNGKKIFEGDIVQEDDVIHNGGIQIKGKVGSISLEKSCFVTEKLNVLNGAIERS